MTIRSSSKFEQILVILEHIAVISEAVAYLFLGDVKITGSLLIGFHKREASMPA